MIIYVCLRGDSNAPSNKSLQYELDYVKCTAEQKGGKDEMWL